MHLPAGAWPSPWRSLTDSITLPICSLSANTCYIPTLRHPPPIPLQRISSSVRLFRGSWDEMRMAGKEGRDVRQGTKWGELEVHYSVLFYSNYLENVLYWDKLLSRFSISPGSVYIQPSICYLSSSLQHQHVCFLLYKTALKNWSSGHWELDCIYKRY